MFCIIYGQLLFIEIAFQFPLGSSLVGNWPRIRYEMVEKLTVAQGDKSVICRGMRDIYVFL